MKLIVLDFMRRWWWMLLLSCAFSVMMLGADLPLLFIPPVFFCLINDSQHGWMRVLRTLPVPVSAQTSSVWFIGVIMMPLFLLVALPIGAGLLAVTQPAQLPAYWFAGMVGWWINLGYAALLFMGVAPTAMSPGATRPEAMIVWLRSAIWGLAMPGTILLAYWLPKSPANLSAGHQCAMALVPLCLWLSWRATPKIIGGRLSRLATGTVTATTSAEASKQGLSGMTLLVTGQIFKHLLLIGALILSQIVLYRYAFGQKQHNDSMLGAQTPMFVLIFAAVSAEKLNLRSLRIMPVGTFRLAVVLLLAPWVMSLGVAGLMAEISQHAVPKGSFIPQLGRPELSFLFNFIAFGALLSGLSSLLLVAMMHINSGWRMAIMVPAAMFSSLIFSMAGGELGWFLGMGLVMLVAAFLWLYHGLRKSSVIYQRRRNQGWGTMQGCEQSA